MLHARGKTSPLANHLLIVGGFGGSSTLSSTEIYMP